MTHDATLGREVGIKLLLDEVSGDPDSGTVYTSTVDLAAPAKKVAVAIRNTGYKPLQ